MIGRLARAAHEWDAWLHENAGRTYIGILTWGLVVSIIGSLGVLGRALSGGEGGLAVIVVLVFQSALLVNQLAQWHELRQRRHLRRDAGLGVAELDG